MAKDAGSSVGIVLTKVMLVYSGSTKGKTGELTSVQPRNHNSIQPTILTQRFCLQNQIAYGIPFGFLPVAILLLHQAMIGDITTVGANHKRKAGSNVKLVTTKAVVVAIVPASIIVK